jgi:prepilin-type N-terminal cleavage/methylation domain-containing protein
MAAAAFVRTSARNDRGFSLVEMTTSVAVLLVVLTAAWLLLTVSNDNLNTIDNGGQASELNRAALAAFERDLNHSVLPGDDVSPLLRAGARRCDFLADVDNDPTTRELVSWQADDENHTLVRMVTSSTETTPNPTTPEDFAGGEVATTTVVTGLSSVDEYPEGSPAMFTYATDATTGFTSLGRVGLVSFHLRNGLPDSTQNVVDRTAAYRVIALVINGY